MPAAEPPVEALGKRLEVHIGRIEVMIQLGARFGAHVAGGDRDGTHAPLATGSRHIDRVLEKDDRIVVGERDTSTPELERHFGQGLGVGGIGQGVHLARLAHVPVLAEATGEIAAGGAERQIGVPGRKWFSGFFSTGSTQKPLERPYDVSTI